MKRHHAIALVSIATSTLLSGLKAHASITVTGQSEQHYVTDASKCAANDTCDLKNFRLVVYKKKVLFPGDPDKNASYETDVRAVYETAAVADIEKYAIVQRIRGCQFDSYWDGKKETRDLTIIRDQFGKNVPFVHSGWQIDNDYPGPIYTGDQAEDGTVNYFALLRWNKDPKSLDANNANFYGQSKPTSPVVFATDLPGAEGLLPGSGLPLHATNSSLQFRTCLFKTADLPKTTDVAGTNVPWDKAIRCFSWDHQFVYDFQLGRYTNPTSIDPFCGG